MDTIVRVSKGRCGEYVKPFECDATNHGVPRVHADRARSIVDMVRTHPLGRKPLDAGNIDDCLPGAARRLRRALQHRALRHPANESPEALEKVEEIAAVPGFDALLFGAGDFSHRIRQLGKATPKSGSAAPHPVLRRRRAQARQMVPHTTSLFRQKEKLIRTSVFTIVSVISLGDSFHGMVSAFNQDGGAKGKSDSVYR